MQRINRKQAREIAQAECARRNWTWNESIDVKWGFFSYVVWGGGRKGGNICIRIRKKDGVIVSSSISPK